MRRTSIALDGADRAPAAQLLRRPQVRLADLAAAGAVDLDIAPGQRHLDLPSVETEFKYAGYLARQQAAVERTRRQEHQVIPPGFRYDGVPGLSREVVERLTETRPRTLGQALRVPGVTPGRRHHHCRPRRARRSRRYGPRHMSHGRPRSREPRGPAAAVPLSRGDLAERLRQRAARARIDVSGRLLDSLVSYIELLRRWNARVNLTGLDAGDEGLDRLIVEPLAAARHVASPTPRVIDIGAGGGSPAIPLRLALPGSSLLMVEARARKAAFLREAVRHLGLTDTAVEARRFEELAGRPPWRDAFDVLTVRAVRVDAAALRRLQALVTGGGELFLFTGPRGDAPLAAVEPPLAPDATWPLVPSLQSRLVVLRKAPADLEKKK